MRAIAAALVSALLPATVCAQADGPAALPEFVTDRPDFTEATQPVGRGVVQYENGFTMDRTTGALGLTGGEMLLRVGIWRRVEWRIGGAGLLIERPAGGQASRGYSGTEFGVKIAFVDQTRRRPAFSAILNVGVPSGSRSFSSRAYEPTVKLLWAKDLGAGFSLAGNVNLSSLGRGEQRFLQTASSWSVGRDLFAGFGAYGEIYTFQPWEKRGRQSWIANTGLMHAMGPNAQFDVRVGRSVSGPGPDWFFGAGIAFRRPARSMIR